MTGSLCGTGPIVQRLNKLVSDLPEMSDLSATLRLYEVILPLVGDADLSQVPVLITAAQIRAKLKAGIPILVDLDLELDLRALKDLMMLLARTLEDAESESGRNSSLAAAARKIRFVLEEDRLDVTMLVSHILAGEHETLHSIARSLNVEPALLLNLTGYSFRPALAGWRRQLTPATSGIEWDRGYCFICGAGASLGELRGDNKERHLRCGQCGADWRVRRLQCVHCGNEDHHSLGYLYSETRKLQARAEVCNKCKGYLKVITAHSATSAEMLPVEDLATIYLDYIAAERGYLREPLRRRNFET